MMRVALMRKTSESIVVETAEKKRHSPWFVTLVVAVSPLLLVLYFLLLEHYGLPLSPNGDEEPVGTEYRGIPSPGRAGITAFTEKRN